MAENYSKLIKNSQKVTKNGIFLFQELMQFSFPSLK